MPADAHRLEAFAQGRTLRQQQEETRKATARRAWEGGQATLNEIAALAKADRKTVKRWAKDGGWQGGPAGRDAGPPTGNDHRLDNLHVGNRGRDAFRRDDGTG